MPRIHAVNGAGAFMDGEVVIDVHRADGLHKEKQVSSAEETDLSNEFEWEENPEFAIVLVENVDEAIELFNEYSPQFIVSVISEDEAEQQRVWAGTNAPFFGDGFTRWVDGQFSLLRPELGLSNWENGRLFGRSGILSGDSAFTVRLRVQQTDEKLHR